MRGAMVVAAAALLGSILMASTGEARSSRGGSSHSTQPHSTAPRGWSAGDAGGSCTPSSPCTGPKGGVYFYSPGGSKHYLPR